MEKINIAELLRDCPKGMELDCTSYDNVSFDKISDDKKAIYPIFCYITDKEGNRSSISFTEDGCESKRYGAKCVIFPKGKTTWEGFQRPFKDGEIVVYDNPHRDNLQVFIFKKKKENNTLSSCYLMLDGDELDLEEGMYYVTRLATEEEKQKLFKAIKDNGYRWNAETKTLEKLPKFKVGNKIKHKDDKNHTVITITGLKHDYYYIQYYNNIKNEYQNEKLFFTDQDKFELVINKFDINILKPFESKVLVRHSETSIWMPAIFGGYDIPNLYYYAVGGTWWKYCIPYKGNEHLFGTTNDCDSYYKTWQK